MVLYAAKYIFKPELKERLPEFVSLLHEVANQTTAIEILEVLLRYVVQATDGFEEKDIIDVIQKTAIGEDIMETFIDRYINQGIQQGLQQGAIKFFVRLLEARFGRVPQWAKAKIEKADLTSLEEWGIRLLRANSVEEVLNN